MIAPAVVANVMWMLVDFTADNGGTRLVPRSHLTGRHPDKELDKDVEPIAAEGPAGTAMVFDGRMWHGTGANVSDGPRLGVLSTFCGPPIPDTRESHSRHIKRGLGECAAGTAGVARLQGMERLWSCRKPRR